ncbi:hypothetical protein ACFFSW_19755 [Saccharothrix longispora]|uniref:Peptidase inhibitor I78 family protein n=1 Tax=Saccharothrix longispora TaxID=33920 RepID=A0ABU1Q3L0_9PSEU|nr:hypothetical protein [Saccharothrix longispora]MDR6597490.1 hypothetical protein [Saccharothrix longispora]
MNLEDDLRALLADERLDVPVREGAEGALVARAARRRRRRAVGAVAASTAVVLAVGGLATGLRVGGSEPATPPAPHVVTVTVDPPPGYGPLRLGAEERAARDSGLLGAPVDLPGGCRRYPAHDGGAVVASPDGVVVGVRLPQPGTTAAGIGAGSTTAELAAAYPGAAGLVVAMPGRPPWRYSFTAEAGLITAVELEMEDSPCDNR